MSARNGKYKVSEDTFRPSDRAVLEYLHKLVQQGQGDTCTASIPQIAVACDISERQVQISTRRMIEAGFLQRVGYDFSNPDRTKRGTVYKVLIRSNRTSQPKEQEGKKRSIKFIMFWTED